MRCPFCNYPDTQVKDSRPVEEGGAIRRRRVCPECEGRFTTFERVQLREITVLKKDGKKSAFDRDKLAKSVKIACRKRPLDEDTVEKAISQIVRQLEVKGEAEIPSSKIGEMVMDVLASLDQVAYVRYASVYRNFLEAKDFEKFVVQLKLDDSESK